MIKSLSDYGERLQNFIIESYKHGASLDDIERVTNIKKNMIITILDKNFYQVKPSELSSFQVEGDKLLVIADSHVGSMYENLKYIDEAYEMGVKEGVCGCIHLGDIIQGMYDKTAYGTDLQMDYIENKYPSPDEFNTYLILGNHDYGVFNTSDYYMKILESKKGLNVVGYKKAYFEWCKYLFSMEHKIKQLDIFVPERDNMLTLVGHGHELKVKSANRLKCPTVSNDIMSKNQGQVPGFVMLSHDDEKVVVDTYSFDDNMKPKLQHGKYLTRKYDNKYKAR